MKLTIPNKDKGFTLIELLVVIAILAILATIAIMVYSGVQKKGRITKRINDLKAVQAAIELYKSENGTYPITDSASLWQSECPNWGKGSSGQVIPGLVPTYLQQMPVDPSMTGNDSCYVYKGTSAGYKFIDRLVTEFSAADYLSRPELVDPWRDGTPNCTVDGTAPTAWAVYSPGGCGF